VQTIRGLENFRISGIAMYHFEHFIRAFAFREKAAARANSELGALDAAKADAIMKACDEIAAGKLHDQFPIDMIQGGAGTSTNMNANEVIANRALEILGHRKGQYEHFTRTTTSTARSPRTTPTRPRSSSASSSRSRTRSPPCANCAPRSTRRRRNFADVLKMGRTENQDAVPMTLGQEFSAYAVMIGDGIRHLTRVGEEFSRSTWARPRSAPASTARPDTPRSARSTSPKSAASP
jgi:aspartate ammonia-lyase